MSVEAFSEHRNHSMWSFQGSFYHLIDFYPGPHPASGREKAWSSTLENFNGTNLGKEHTVLPLLLLLELSPIVSSNAREAV